MEPLGTPRPKLADALANADLLVDRAYAKVYGGNFEEAVSPLPVAEPADQRVRAAA